DAGRAEDAGADRHSHDHGQPIGQAQRALEVGHMQSVIRNRACAREGNVHGKTWGRSMLRPYIVRPAPTFTERMFSLRPAARPSAAVAVVPAPAPAPISPAAGSRPAAAVP